jgi:hypothetical protein
MDQKAIHQAVMDIRAIDELIATGIFDPSLDHARLRKAALIEVMICLGELVRRCEAEGLPITFTDDVLETSAVSDIADLISFVRHELCHSTRGGERRSVFRYAAVRGKALPIATGSATLVGGCDYADDIAYCFSDQRIYWKRHILRAFDEVKARLAPPGSEVARNI